MIAELSEVSRLDAGLTTLVREPVDLFVLVEDVANGVHESSERDVRLEVRGEAAGSGFLSSFPRRFARPPRSARLVSRDVGEEEQRER